MQNVRVCHIVVCSDFSNLFCVGSPDGIVPHLGRQNYHTNAFAGSWMCECEGIIFII